MKRAFALFVTLLVGSPLLCGVLFVVLFVTIVAFTIPQLPAWAQPGVTAWLLDQPQETYDPAAHQNTPGSAGAPQPYNGGQIAKADYTGNDSFRCILPPMYGYLTDTYGTYREGGYIHSGIDYGCYFRPVPVYTPFGGKVVFAGWSQVGYGNLVVIENNGVQVFLAHNSEMFVQEGDVVNAGDPIGLCGSTGNSTGYHVHFEVRVWSENSQMWLPVDPNSVLLPGQEGYCDWYSLKTGEPP